MTSEPNRRPQSQEKAGILGYATQVGEYPRPRAQTRLISLLLLLTALCGLWSIILGAFSPGDAWGFGLLLIAAGSGLFWAVIGKLSAAKMRLRASLILLCPSIAIYIFTILIAQRLYAQQRSLYAAELQAFQSDWHHLPTEAEHQVFTYAMFRDNALVGTALGAACSIYSIVRLVARRGIDFH